ncbi:MAG TPA: hypothetical protein VLS25_06055 [Dehalococcoidia bacterium]|nr:hypothetical protein [Dehalococcoidia bacterium]
MLLGHGGENIARMIGSNFAPGYVEERVYVEEETCQERGGYEECAPGYYMSKFHSTNRDWQRALNSDLLMVAVPLGMFVLIAWGGRYPLRGIGGGLVAWARYEGHKDTWAQAITWSATVGIPVTMIVLIAAYGLGRLTGYTGYSG